MANCHKRTACTIAELDAVSDPRPWGASNPRWQLYAYAPLRSIVPPGAVESPWYVVLLVGDDPLRADNILSLRAEAFGPRNGHAVVEALVGRPAIEHSDYNGESPAPVKILSWREVR
jgi:hypothetical protein